MADGDGLERRIERIIFRHRSKFTVLVCFELVFLWGIMRQREEPITPPAPTVAVTPLEKQIPRDDYRGLPPPEFRGEWMGSVRFVDDVKPYCGPNAYACGDARGLILPNPCTPDRLATVGYSTRSGSLSMMKGDYDWLVEEYRTTVCHEIGHAHGWPGNHWIASDTEIAAIRKQLLGKLYEYDQQYGGMELEWLVGLKRTDKEDAAIAAMVADRDIQVSTFKGRGKVARLTRCKYWTMRNDREGDGSKKMAEACKTDA